MDLDDFAKGAVASLLADQVAVKTGLVAKIGGAVVTVAAVVAFLAEGLPRWLAGFVVVLGLALLLFVYVSKRLALGLINKLAPPVEMENVRAGFDTAIAEADLPTGPVALLRLIWRLRKGVVPEIERLGAVVTQLRTELE